MAQDAMVCLYWVKNILPNATPFFAAADVHSWCCSQYGVIARHKNHRQWKGSKSPLTTLKASYPWKFSTK